MIKFKSKDFFFILLGAFTFSSCNVSMNVLNRKYRPGFSVTFSKKLNSELNKSKINDEATNDIQKDSTVVENDDGSIVASANSSDLFVNDYIEPVFIMPCDTPPKKIMEDPNFLLYNEKKATGMSKYRGRILEPYGLLADIFLALGFFTTALLEYLSVPLFLFVFFSVFVMSIISLIKMRKMPDKYMRIFKLTDWIFLAFYIIGLFILLAAT